MADPITSYIAELQRNFRAGIATEHTYRPGLKAYIEALGSGTTAFNDPKRVECGAPDFTIARNTKHGPFTIGYIEAKDLPTDLEGIERDAARKNPTTQNGEQVKRYLTLPNLILTDYLEFRWYVDGQRRMIARVARPIKADRLEKERDGGEAVAQLIRHFLDHEPPLIAKPKDLAVRMARLTHRIRDMIITAFDSDRASNMLRDLHTAFEETLIPDLSIPNFADMYAQTLAYGLFAARVNHAGRHPFRRLGAAAEIPKTNPFLRRLFDTITGAALDDEPYVGFVDDLAQLLDYTDIPVVLADFGKRGVRQDPVLHFYETFLAAYDPEIRERRGVYYTPEPVVSYIVRSVDYLLRTRFGCSEGLADACTIRYVGRDPEGQEREESCHRVLILDPACGTGTFLYSAVDLMREQFMRRGNAGMWAGYVREHLLPRLFGFELMMAPYAMAHLKLGMQLAALDMPEAQRADWACDLTSDRLGVYLTNTLEEAIKKSDVLMGSFISDEANAAVRVKRELPILIVLGNPPYSGHSANKGAWIRSLVRDYYQVDGQPLGEKNPKWLQDDYVKFIRFGQWRIQQRGAGILAFITNHGYLDNPTFRGMRQQLMQAFTDIYVLDLHGNSKKKERCPDGSPDENVFDIQQGVAIGIFVKEPRRSGPATVHHAELWGLRESKYKTLFETDLASTEWTDLTPESPFYLFVPQRTELRPEYERGWKLTDAIGLKGVGMTTARDHVVIDYDEEPLLQRARLFRDSSESDSELCRLLGTPEKKGWNIPSARRLIREESDLAKHVKAVLYRPFDSRLIFYHDSLVWRTVRDVMRHMLADHNLGLATTRSVEIGRGYEHAFCTRSMIQHHSVSLKEVNYLFPLYLYPSEQEVASGFYQPDERRPNLARAFVADMEKRLGLTFVSDGTGDLEKTFGPEDVFHYIYAVLHSPTYRTRYAEFLKTDFPRIPLTSDMSVFRTLCALGAELVALHLMESPLLDKLITSYPVAGDDIVERVAYRAPGEPEPGSGKPLEKGRVYISQSKPKEEKTGQYFDGVSPEVWGFHVGGYQVCEKWLKDRKGRVLSYDDRVHYQKIVVALHGTIRLMAQIDQVIPSWPLQ